MMTMERSRGSKVFRVAGSVVALLALGLIFFFTSGVSSSVRNLLANTIARHVEPNPYDGLSRDALVARLTVADTELRLVKYQALLYSTLAQENADIRKTMNASTVPLGVTARVLARPPRTTYDTILIDAGKNMNVHENDIALYQGIALGRVSAVDQSSSLVTLFSSTGVTHDVIIGEPHAVVVAKGVGGGAFELSVPHDVVVGVGDAVRFPGTGALILGVVRGISAEARDVSQTVRVALPVSFSDLDFIRVIPAQ